MTGQELAELIGREGLLTTADKLRVPVRVTDAKRAYGNLRYRVTPLHNGAIKPAAMGQAWVGSERVQLTEKA